VNVAEEAVAEELLPYKEFLHQLYLDKIIRQLLHFVFVFLFQLVNLAMINSSANATNSKPNTPNPIAKASNSIAKATN